MAMDVLHVLVAWDVLHCITVFKEVTKEGRDVSELGACEVLVSRDVLHVLVAQDVLRGLSWRTL